MEPVHKRLLNDGGRLIYSDHEKVGGEIQRSGMSDYFTELGRAGRAKRISRDKVEKAVRDITGKYKLKSDDPHIFGPAVAAKVKLLCTGDEKLMGDFKKRVPRGRVHRV